MMLEFQREAMKDILPELQEITARACAEVGHQELEFDADWDMYLAMEAANRLWMMTARIGGSLAGYNIFLLYHPHYKSSRVAQNDAIYLMPEYRRGKHGIKLIRHAEIALAALGIQKIFYHSKPRNSFGGLLDSLGYDRSATIHTKTIIVGGE